MRIAITGGTGFIGAPLVQRLAKDGHDVLVLARRPESLGALPPGVHAAFFDTAQEPLPSLLDGREAVFHLAGETIARRWTAAQKERVMKTRIQGTQAIARAAAASGVKRLISASAIGYYGPRGDEVLDESAPAGDDFLARLCRAWEDAAEPARAARLTVIHPRIGLVLHPSGGALERMGVPFKAGLGGKLGSGAQWMSWIHREDLLALLSFLLTAPLDGPVNATAPAPVTNEDFTRALGKALRRPAVMAVPAFAMKLALGEMAAMVLTGQRVVPKKALDAGFTFRFTELAAALADLYPA